jgi:hypothetical protein
MSDFEFLVLHVSSEAALFLGLAPMPDGEKPEANLPVARKLIDALASLQDRTRGQLSIEEQRMLENTITELRFRYVQAFETDKVAKAAPAQPEGNA